MPPDFPDPEKHLHLRALFRQHKPGFLPGKTSIDPVQQAGQRRIVMAEYQRLYGEASTGGKLEEILRTVWTEEKELRGLVYNHTMQRWEGPDGTPVPERGHG